MDEAEANMVVAAEAEAEAVEVEAEEVGAEEINRTMGVTTARVSRTKQDSRPESEPRHDMPP